MPPIRNTRVPRPRRSHPSLGGARGYSVPYRQLDLQLPPGERGASRQSHWRWARRLDPHAMFGGEHLYLLVLCRQLYPKADADEIRAFIYSQSQDPKIVYSREDITKAGNAMGLTRKRSSTTAYQALTPQNIHRREVFWTNPYPIGIAGTSE